MLQKLWQFWLWSICWCVSNIFVDCLDRVMILHTTWSRHIHHVSNSHVSLTLLLWFVTSLYHISAVSAGINKERVIPTAFGPVKKMEILMFGLPFWKFNVKWKKPTYMYAMLIINENQNLNFSHLLPDQVRSLRVGEKFEFEFHVLSDGLWHPDTNIKCLFIISKSPHRHA